MSWSRLSIEHGPAITVSEPSPIVASRTRITVSSGWNSREVSLNGRLIGVTVSTPGSASSRLMRTGLRGADLADHGDDHALGARRGRTGSGPRRGCGS